MRLIWSTKTLIALSCACTMVGVLTIVSFGDKEAALIVVSDSSVIGGTGVSGQKTDRLESTIAEIWEWDSFPEKHEVLESDPDTEKLFDKFSDTVIDPEYLYSVLQDVQLDANGDVVLDYRALQALELTVSRGRLGLDAIGLAELQALIQVGLPGKAGEQTARVVGDFYNYLGAKDELAFLHQPPVEGDKVEWRKQYRDLISLREMYLGKDVADALFVQANANTEYMIEMFALDADATLEEAVKHQRRVAVTEKLVADLISITAWSVRYGAYKNDRDLLQAKIGAKLNEMERDDLLAQHFSLEEIEQLIYLNVDAML
jgi:Proteobacterial lipase chaperone protein